MSAIETVHSECISVTSVVWWGMINVYPNSDGKNPSQSIQNLFSYTYCGLAELC